MQKVRMIIERKLYQMRKIGNGIKYRLLFLERGDERRGRISEEENVQECDANEVEQRTNDDNKKIKYTS